MLVIPTRHLINYYISRFYCVKHSLSVWESHSTRRSPSPSLGRNYYNFCNSFSAHPTTNLVHVTGTIHLDQRNPVRCSVCGWPNLSLNSHCHFLLPTLDLISGRFLFRFDIVIDGTLAGTYYQHLIQKGGPPYSDQDRSMDGVGR